MGQVFSSPWVLRLSWMSIFMTSSGLLPMGCDALLWMLLRTLARPMFLVLVLVLVLSSC